MKNRSLLMTLTVILIASIVFFIPLQKVRAIGNKFEEGIDGFSVGEGKILTYNVSAASPDFGFFDVNDKFEITITKANNSELSYPVWTADTLFSIWRYYNHTAKNWTVWPGGESLVAGYNSTDACSDPESGGQYYLYFENNVIPFIICNNFSAANHLIVDLTYKRSFDSSPSFQHVDPVSINGTWHMWNGTATTPNSDKYNITYNGLGILTKYSVYENGTTDWQIVYELTLLPSELGGLGGFLFLIMNAINETASGYLFTGLGISAAIVVIPLMIGFIARYQMKK